MIRRTILAVLLLAAVAANVAADAQQDFLSANDLFAQRQYQAAADLYSKILEEGFANSAVEYNLGNALYRLSMIGEARLHFERAVRLDPGGIDARSNIEIIEKRYLKQSLREENFTSTERVIRRTLSAFPAGLTFAVGIACFLLLNVVFALRLLFPAALHPAVYWTALIALAVVAAASLAIATGQSLLASSRSYGIIVARDAGVASEPAADAPSRFPAPEAMKVQIEREQDGWTEIVLPNNAKGWVAAGAVETI